MTTKNSSIYNIIRWYGSMTGQKTRWPSVWCSKHYFFIISYRLRADKTIYFCFLNLQKNKKINWKGFCKKFCKILWKKNNTWNTRPLVNESFITLAQQTSVLYCRLTDFKVHCWLIWRCMQKEICHLFGKFFCLTISWSVWIWQWEER